MSDGQKIAPEAGIVDDGGTDGIRSVREDGCRIVRVRRPGDLILGAADLCEILRMRAPLRSTRELARGDALQINVRRVVRPAEVVVHVTAGRVIPVGAELQEAAEILGRRPRCDVPALAEVGRPDEPLERAGFPGVDRVARVLPRPQRSGAVEHTADGDEAPDLAAESRSMLRVGRVTPDIDAVVARPSAAVRRSTHACKAETDAADRIVI